MPRPTRVPSLSALAIALMVLAGSLCLFMPTQAAPGDITAPIYADGDWWNYSLSRSTSITSRAGSYDIEFTTAQGWFGYEVEGTTSHAGEVAWSMVTTGRVRLSGEWEGGDDVGTTTLEAKVRGREWRSVTDLSYLGSDTSYKGEVEIATKTGPQHFNITIWENRTVSAPLRMMLFPMPVATFPKEGHNVTITISFETGGHSTSRTERWTYTSEYKGLSDAQGNLATFTNQHRFHVVGNVTVGGEQSMFDRSVYHDSAARKAPSLDQVWGLEITNYFVSQAAKQPDLVADEEEFTASNYLPAEGDFVNITASVYNLGQVVVHQVGLELWSSLDGDLPVRENSTTIESIDPNQEATVHFGWEAGEEGEYEFTLRVDPANTFTESREDNNEVTLVIAVVPFALKPNLVLGDAGVELFPESPVEKNTGMLINVSVANVGLSDAYNVTVDVYLGQPGAGGVLLGRTESIDIVPVAQTRWVWFTWSANATGSHKLWVNIDPDNRVNESEETDNLGSVPIIIVSEPVGGVDLVVARVKVLDSYGEETSPIPMGEKTTIQVVLENHGPEDATRVHLSLYVDTMDTKGLIGSKDGVLSVDAFVTWELTWTVDVEDGDHLVLAKVLALGDVDRDIDDNERAQPITVGPRTQPKPEVLAVTVYPDSNYLTAGQRIKVTGRVTYAKNGFEVPGATVTVQFLGLSGQVEDMTDETGRYNVEIDVPNRPGTYRLQASVVLGRSEGDHSVSVTVAEQDSGTVGSGGEDEGLNPTFYFVSVVIVIAVAMPVTYYILVSKQALKRRIRRVHEEIVEIVDEEK